MDTGMLQTMVSISPTELEALIRRVVREEVGQLLTRHEPIIVSENGDAESMLIEKSGFLVARVEPLEDLTDIVERSRRQRLDELIERIGL